VAAAASLAGLPRREARRLLAELARASLLAEHAPDRYAFHDLLRAYATDLALHHDAPAEHRAALGRLVDHHLHSTVAADRHLAPHREPSALPLTPPGPGVTVEDAAGYQEALAWLDAEHAGLLATLRRAVDAGLHCRAWQLGWALGTFLHRRAHLADLTEVWQVAVAAATGLDHPAAAVYAHLELGRVSTRLGRYRVARVHLRHALAQATRTGDATGQAHVHACLQYLNRRLGRFGPALHHGEQAFGLYRAAGNGRGQAEVLNGMGGIHAELGDHAQALADCTDALARFRRFGDRVGQADTWDSLGQIHHALADHARAADCYRHACAFYRDLGDHYQLAVTTTSLGDTLHAAGRPAAAHAAWQDAFDLFTGLAHPDADALRTKLDGPDPARFVPPRP
jgi:tetratricopeptide (TPR) repeat protein